MWPFTSGNILDAQLGQAGSPFTSKLDLGIFQNPQQFQQAGQQPVQPEPTGVNRILSNPTLVNALGRMGSVMMIASSRPGGTFAGGLGAGFGAFQDVQDREAQLARDQQQQGVENGFRERQLGIYQQKADQEKEEYETSKKTGFQYKGWEGDMARTIYEGLVARGVDPLQARTQAVQQVESRLRGAYDPVTGDYRMQQRGSLLPTSTGPAYPMPEATPQMPTAPGATMTEDQFVTSLRNAESGGRRYGPNGQLLTSDKGAMGEMQVMPATMRDPGYGVMPARDTTPTEIARVGDDYARMLYQRYNGNAELAAAAYNGGPGAMDARIKDGRGLSGMPAESQNHAAKVAGFTPSGNRKQDAETQGAIARRTAELQLEQEAVTRKAQTEKQGELPKVVDQGNYMLRLIDQAANHPGLEDSVGGPGGLLGRQAQAFPLTDGQRDFAAISGQMRGGVFREAFESLKGGGAITEVEGTKAEQAIARLQQSQSLPAYKAALSDLREVVAKGIERSRSGASLTPQQQAASAPATLAPPAPGTAVKTALPKGVTEEDIAHTMKLYNVSREEVLRRISR